MPRQKALSGLPEPIPGEPFSLLGTLRRCRSTLTVDDIAQLLLCSKKAVYAQINAGRIPVVDLGFDITRVDPKAWAHVLEHDNKHLLPSTRALRAA